MEPVTIEHPKTSESAVRNKLINLLSELRGFKFVTTIVIYIKLNQLSTKAETIINESDMDDEFESIYTMII